MYPLHWTSMGDLVVSMCSTPPMVFWHCQHTYLSLGQYVDNVGLNGYCIHVLLMDISDPPNVLLGFRIITSFTKQPMLEKEDDKLIN